MSEERYNGWKNYETWAMALWIDNDQGSYNYSREIVAEAATDEHARYEASHALKEWAEESMPELEGVWADLLGAAWESVDWYEIAENYLSELETA